MVFSKIVFQFTFDGFVPDRPTGHRFQLFEFGLSSGSDFLSQTSEFPRLWRPCQRENVGFVLNGVNSLPSYREQDSVV